MHLTVVSTGDLHQWTAGLAAALAAEPTTRLDVLVLDDRPRTDAIALVRTAELMALLVGGQCPQLAHAAAVYEAGYAHRHLTVVVFVVGDVSGDAADWLTGLAAEHPTFKVPAGTSPTEGAPGFAAVVRRALAVRRRCLGPMAERVPLARPPASSSPPDERSGPPAEASGPPDERSGPPAGPVGVGRVAAGSAVSESPPAASPPAGSPLGVSAPGSSAPAGSAPAGSAPTGRPPVGSQPAGSLSALPSVAGSHGGVAAVDGRAGAGTPPGSVPRPRPLPASELEALVHLERVNADEQWNQAVQAWNVGLWDAMAQHLWQLLGNRPLDAEARLWLARLLAASQRRSVLGEALSLADGAARLAEASLAARFDDAPATTGLPPQAATPLATQAPPSGGASHAVDANPAGRPPAATAAPPPPGVPPPPGAPPTATALSSLTASRTGGPEAAEPMTAGTAAAAAEGAEQPTAEPDAAEPGGAWAAEAWLWVARLARQLDPPAAAAAASRALRLAPGRADVRLELVVQTLLADDAAAAAGHAIAAYQLDDSALSTLSYEPALAGMQAGPDALAASVAGAAARGVAALARLLPADPRGAAYPPAEELARLPLPDLAAEGRRLAATVHRSLSADAWSLADDAGLTPSHGLVSHASLTPLPDSARPVADEVTHGTVSDWPVRSVLVRGPTVLRGGGVAVVALVLCGIGAAWVFGSAIWVLPGLALAVLAALVTMQVVAEDEAEAAVGGAAPNGHGPTAEQAANGTQAHSGQEALPGQGAPTAEQAPGSVQASTTGPAVAGAPTATRAPAASHAPPPTRPLAAHGPAATETPLAGPGTARAASWGPGADLSGRLDALRQQVDAFEEVVAAWPAWVPVVPVDAAAVGDLVLLSSETMPYDVAVDPSLVPPGLRTAPEPVAARPRLHRVVARDQAMRFAARWATYFPWSG